MTKDILNYIDRCVLCWLATVSADGQPNVSPKEIFVYHDNHLLSFPKNKDNSKVVHPCFDAVVAADVTAGSGAAVWAGAVCSANPLCFAVTGQIMAGIAFATSWASGMEALGNDDCWPMLRNKYYSDIWILKNYI